MRKNSKFTIYCLIFYCLIFTNLHSNEIKKFKSIDEFYQLNIPSKIYLNIIGEDYIKYLKQIRLVGKKQNLNVSKINSSKKKWIRGYLNTDQSEKKYKIRFILHGDFNDHIEIPYSSLRVKSKNSFFQQLEDFILFKPKTRRYEAEVFGTILLREIGIMSPFTRYIKLKINDNHFENYIFQEKISKFMIERYGYREGPILEYDEKNLWNKYSLNLENKNSSGFYKIDNAKYSNNKNNLNKIFESVTAKKNKINLHQNIYNELFETALILMGGCHGLHEHNRKYYYDSLNQIFLPIYYDGMLFYDKSNNLCETFRKNSDYSVSKSNFYKIKHILNNDQFKKKINKIFYRNVFDHDKFEYYWEYLENNLEKLETILQKNDFKKNIFFPNKNIELYKNLKDLDLPYPTIFFYKDLKNKNYYLCHEWFDIDKDIKLFVDNKTLSKEKNQGCDLIDEERLVNLIKQRVVYKTNLNKNLEIIPILVGNINQKYEIKNENILKVKYLTKIDKDKNLEINLDNSSIIILELDQDSILETLKVNSSIENNSAFILKLNNKSLNKVEFNEIIPSGENINNLIGEKNITGCLNIINSNFKIKKLLINGSNCEDGVNIINSIGKIEFIDIQNAISDALDFDYSNIEIGNINVNNAKGDCLDFSFGNYSINESVLNNCRDKAISVGETSKLKGKNINISNANFGIASKDNSIANIKTLNIKKVKYCLAAYNKKKEFSGGKINIIKMSCDNYQQQTFLDEISEIKIGENRLIND